MKKGLIKYILIFLMLGSGAMIYIYAQKGYLFKEPKTKNEIKVEEKEPVEDTGIITGDDPWKEMDKLVSAYYNKQGISYKGLVKLIDDNGNKEKIIEEHKFEYSTLGQNMYYQLDNMEFVNKPGLILIADHDNKFISVSNQDRPVNEQQKLFDIGEFKKLMEKTNAKAKVTQLGDQKILTIENITDPQIQGYRIYYDPVTYQVSKMLIGMLRLSPLTDDEGGIEETPGAVTNKINNKENISEEPAEDEIETYTYYLEIIYDEMKVLNISEKTFRLESKFIIKKDNKIELMPAFSKYQFINNGSVQNETEGSEEQE
jgi:hypothetical protein